MKADITFVRADASEPQAMSTGMRRAIGALLLCSSLAAMLPGQALAQDAARDGGVNEIIVTAQRRSEKLEEVPMSVTAISAETAEKAGVRGLTDLGQVSPGVIVSFNGAMMQPAIRGVTNILAGNGFENNVPVYIDGFYTPDVVSIAGDIANISSIEVLKGPQGALYGRNATGGAILINTLAPSETMTAKGEFSFARFDEVTASGYVSGPIADMVRFSVSGYTRTSDGYIRFSNPTVAGGKPSGNASPTKSRSMRAKLEAELSEGLTVQLGYNYSYVDDFRSLLFTPVAYTLPVLPPPPDRAAEGFDDQKSYNHEHRNSARTNEGTLKIILDTGIGTLTSYNSYAKRKLLQWFDFDGTYRDLTYSKNFIYFDTMQSALDLQVDAIEGLDIVTGVSYYEDKRKADPAASFGLNNVPTTITIQRGKGKAYAAYLDVTYHLTDALSINAGGRYTRERRTSFISQQTLSTGLFGFPPTTKSKAWDSFTPRASIRYEVAPRTNVYASYSKGFKIGGFNFSPPATPAEWLPINPEKIDAFEVGFKTAQSNFRFDIAGFYYSYKDIHVSAAIPDPLCLPGQICSIKVFTVNGPKSRIYGVDGQFTYEPTPELTLRLGASYLHARYIDFTNATGTGLRATNNTNIPNQFQDWSDKQMARSPTFSGNAAIDYERETSAGTFAFSSSANFTSSYVVSNPSLYGPLAPAGLAGKQRYRQGGHVTVNAQLNWTEPSGHVTLGVFARNLTNKRTWINYAGLTFGDYGQKNSPRVVGARLAFQY